MNKTFLKKMKALLLEQKEEVVKSAAQDLVIDNDGDETDEIQANQLLEMNHQLIARSTTKMLQIDAALKRIEEGTYGLCQDCEEPIAEKRLLSNPYFQTCISCAEEREVEEKQKKR